METMGTPKKELAAGSASASKYRITGEPGKDGMIRVYKAIDREVNGKIAAKFIMPEIASLFILIMLMYSSLDCSPMELRGAAGEAVVLHRG